MLWDMFTLVIQSIENLQEFDLCELQCCDCKHYEHIKTWPLLEKLQMNQKDSIEHFWWRQSQQMKHSQDMSSQSQKEG